MFFTMKIKTCLILIVAALAGALAPSANAQPSAAASGKSSGDVRTDVRMLVMQIQQKLQALGGARPTEAQFAAELDQFEKIIAGNPKADANELAQILMMKSEFYVEVLNDLDAAAALVRRIKAEYPKTEAAAHTDEMLKQLEQFRAMQALRESMRAARDALKPGAEFPDFSVTDLNGKPLSLSQFKGKVVLVDFWATWCPPCVAEMPRIIATYQKYHDKGFEVIGISLDRDKAELLKYIEKNKIAWPQHFDGGKAPGESLAEKYGAEAIPTTFLIGADGKIIAATTGPMGGALEEHLAKLLK